MPPEKHAICSASGAGRWMHCTAAPRFEEQFPESTSPYAEEGRLAHEFCELKAKKKFTLEFSPKQVSAKLTKLRKHELYNAEMDKTSDLYLEHLTEQAMSYDSPPFATFEQLVDFSEYVPEGFGTCDSILIGGDLLCITDYKHGQGVPVSAEGNPQMRLYALGALNAYAIIYGGSIKRVRMTIDQPRLDNYSTEEISVPELLDWGERLKPTAREAYDGPGQFRPGDWCRFCRGKAQCRARAEQNSALNDFRDIAPIPPGKLTDAEIGELLRRGKDLAAWYKDLEEYALKTLLAGGEIPGWKAVAGRSIRTWSNQDAAFEALRSDGYDDAILYDKKPKTLSELEKLVGKDDFACLCGEYIIKPPGKPTLAPESDKRERYSSAQSDFSDIVNNQ